jgi:hypothetical protein
MADSRIPHTTKPRNDLTAEYVRSILDYDPETGLFRWKARTGVANSCNARRCGMLAGHRNKRNGYVYIGINGKIYLASRLAWLHHTGEWPRNRIDHKDGNPSFNGIKNLRDATASQNMACARMRRTNKTGYPGVQKRFNKWKATITIDGRIMQLGYFDTPAAAGEAYEIAAKKFRGEFADRPRH